MGEDGNSRNGYHKVKCQVPETEELQGGGKGEQKDMKAARLTAGPQMGRNSSACTDQAKDSVQTGQFIYSINILGNESFRWRTI